MNWQLAVEKTVTGLGYDLVDTERSPKGLLRVYIDKPAPAVPPAAPSGSEFITVEDCERVTRQLQHVLEVEGCAYERLEVSSPGLDRPLKKPADFLRFSGERVDLTLKLAFKGRKHFQGVLEPLESPGQGWRLVFQGDGVDQALDFAFDEVREARLVPVVDFKGRRFAAPVEAPTEQVESAGNEMDGDRKR
ncbi:MAG: ribosome maturation factor RimP [Burkholderiaceae bacterium]|nr:ribosome maturation factor RimP [Burkholderiaceae bacterium]